MKSDLTAATKKQMRTPYVLRRVPEASFASLLALSDQPRPGDVALAQMEKAGRTGGSFARADGPLPNCPWYDAALRAATKRLRAELYRPAQTHRQS